MVFDPVPMRMVRLACRERAQLLVEAPTALRPAGLPERLERTAVGLKPPRVLRWHLDVDPAEV